MNKKMRELLAKIQAKTAEAKSFMDGENKDVEKANVIMDEVDALQKEYDTEKRVYETEKATGAQSATATVEPTGQEPEKALTATEIVAKTVRAILNPKKYGNDKGLNETVDAEGGYTVPEDISTAINHWPEVQESLLGEISVENVTAPTGARTYQVKGKPNVFVEVDENSVISEEIQAPNFERITYAVKQRAGFMPVSNLLVADSDASIMNVVTAWLGKANIETANAKILAIIKAKDQIVIDGLDGIKKVVNVTLGQAYKNGAKIITNDDGLNYLDTLKDENGRYLLNPDPTDSAKLQLRCGTLVIPVKVLSNETLASDGTKVPFIIGNLKEGIRKYDRQQISLKASDVASIGNFNAFAQNMTLIRAILRDDYKELDADAYVYGYVTVGE